MGEGQQLSDDDEPPICPVCGVTMVPAELSAFGAQGDWVCLECEETDGDDA
jgi:tRNA(Ile2) C34 agmatinyltransferase TiaS